ncbi:MAG: hypothetical protein P8N76_08130 [Pirellulaceae bacterium]|nr:hypothetical protein [Pirellulaceae bacterium]
MAHNNDLHDVVIIGDASRNVIEGFGIWEHAAHASNLEDGQDFAAFIADVTDNLAEPLNRNDLELLYRMNAGT